MEGLALWKNNVDKRFEGIEDCMICFSVIHGSNYSLPKKACRTCKKKFHSACLVRCISDHVTSLGGLPRSSMPWTIYIDKLRGHFFKSMILSERCVLTFVLSLFFSSLYSTNGSLPATSPLVHCAEKLSSNTVSSPLCWHFFNQPGLDRCGNMQKVVKKLIYIKV